MDIVILEGTFMTVCRNMNATVGKGRVSGDAIVMKGPKEKFEFIRNREFPYPPIRKRIRG